MKKLFCILLCVCLLTACSSQQLSFDEQYPSVTEVREFAQGGDKLIGVAYLGYAEGDFDKVSAYLSEQAFRQHYSFITQIPSTHFVQAEGAELYCVVPADGVSLSICSVVLDETDYQLKPGEELLSVADGMPVLLQGNISDIMANLMIVAKKGDVAIQYAPSLSLENGTLSNYNQLVYDFTPYSYMDQYVGNGTEAEWDFYGDWTCTVTEADGTVFDLALSISSDGVEYSYVSEKAKGDYHGEWLIMADGKLRLCTDGHAEFADTDGFAAQNLEVDAMFDWQVDDAGLSLKYFNGDPLYPGVTFTEFQFVSMD